MGKIKEFCRKHREVLLYLVFGGLTTLVGWVVYFSILWSWRAVFDLASDDTGSRLYLCKRVMDGLGHGISIRSWPGQGTDERLELDSGRGILE